MADDDTISVPKVPSDAIVHAQQIREKGVETVVADVAADNKANKEKTSKGGLATIFPCCFGGKDEADERLENLKKEVSIIHHKTEITAFFKEFDVDCVATYPDPDDETKFNVDRSDIKGLTDAQVNKKREIYGFNQLTPPTTKSELRKLFDQLTGFFSLLLWAGSFLCLISFILRNDMDNLYLFIVLFFVVVATGVFGYFQERKSSQLMDSFKNMMPKRTTVIRKDADGNQKLEDINAAMLVPGDVVALKAGMAIPADVRIIRTEGTVKVDNSALTGESEPQTRGTEMNHENPLETKNLAFFGTMVVKGTCDGMVINTADRTVMGLIAALASGTEDKQTPINKEIHKFVTLISGIAIILGVSFFIINLVKQADIVTNLVFMIGIIVANVPEGLLLTVTVCLTLTAQRMATSNVLVKDLEGVETLGSTSCICSDKTGTLTQNMMTVDFVCFDGVDYQAECGAKKANVDVESPTHERMQRCATLCNNVVWDAASKFGTKKCKEWERQGREDPTNDPSISRADLKKLMVDSEMPDETKPVDFEKINISTGMKKVMWKAIGDATESALAKYAQRLRDIDEYKREWVEVCQVPFNSKNKYQISVRLVPGEDQHLICMKGAPERIWNRCSHICHKGEVVPFTDEMKKMVMDLQVKCSKKGLRVLGFADQLLDKADYPVGYAFDPDEPNFPIGNPKLGEAGYNAKNTEESRGMVTFLGLFAMIDPARPNVPSAVEKCKTAGIRVIMVTGDHPDTAQAIARDVNIIWGDARRGGKNGPATVEEYEEWNRANGLTPGKGLLNGKVVNLSDISGKEKEDVVAYFDPQLAPAIVVPGWEIIGKETDKGDDKKFWDDILGHHQIVFARTSPQQKLIIVEHCQARGEIVAVTGDGVNDAPALKTADIGVAMGIMGSDVSKDAADMILLDDNFASIVSGVEEGRLIFDNLKKSIAYTLSSNIPEISPFLMFIILEIPLPLSTILILCIDLGTDMIPAISMAWENAESDIMNRPPRDANKDGLVTNKLIVFAYLQIGMIQAVGGFYTWFVVMYDYGFPLDILPQLGYADNWGKQILFCKPKSNVEFVNVAGVSNNNVWDNDFPLWKPSGDVGIQDTFDGLCHFPAKNFEGKTGTFNKWNPNLPCTGNTSSCETEAWRGFTSGMKVATHESMQALTEAGFVPYIPWTARLSPFWDSAWLQARGVDNNFAGIGVGCDDQTSTCASTPNPVTHFTYSSIGQTRLDSSSGPQDASHSCDSSPADVSRNAATVYDSIDDSKVDAENRPLNKMSCLFKASDGHNVYITFDESNQGISSTYASVAAAYEDQTNLPSWNTVKKVTIDGTVEYLTNIASRMVQEEALRHAQTAYFISIVVVQWADLVICKTRMNSIYEQGMLNPAMNFGLIFETMLACILCYTPFLGIALKTRPIKMIHWLPAMPYSIFIFCYDEIRKGIMRMSVEKKRNEATGQEIRNPGWMERNTYY